MKLVSSVYEYGKAAFRPRAAVIAADSVKFAPVKDAFVRAKNEMPIVIEHNDYFGNALKKIKAVLIPDAKAVLRKKTFNPVVKKIEKIDVPVNIARSEDNYKTFYHFLEPATNKEVGYVSIADWRKVKDSIPYKMGMFDDKLIQDYPKLGVVGDRVSVDYVKNNMEGLYGGAGELGDRLAVEYCIKNGIEPQVTQLSLKSAAGAHSKRGYLPISPVENGDVYMYMPQMVAQKYAQKASLNPILP